MSLLELGIRIFFTILVLLVMARLDGPRQIAQMNYYDYAIGITVGSIAASTCLNDSIPLPYGLLAISLFLLSGILMSWLARKSMPLRRFLSGKPIVLIAQGQLRWHGLKQAHMNVNELQSKLRYSGYFDIGQIAYAILEPTGDLSVQAKRSSPPPQPGNPDLPDTAPSLLANVVVDGAILRGNLEAFGKTEAWLIETLNRQGVATLREVGLATLREDGALSVYRKNRDPSTRTSFL